VNALRFLFARRGICGGLTKRKIDPLPANPPLVSQHDWIYVKMRFMHHDFFRFRKKGKIVQEKMRGGGAERHATIGRGEGIKSPLIPPPS